MEDWIIQSRRKVCLACELVKTCRAMPSIFKEATDCPKGAHQPRYEAIAARAWPSDKPAISGCCDRAD